LLVAAGVASVACADPPAETLLDGRRVAAGKGTPQGDVAEPSGPDEGPGQTSPEEPAAPNDEDTAPPATAKPEASPVSVALAYGQSLIGAAYGWWYSGPLPTAAPMWTAGGPPPQPSAVLASSANCAGLTNLMLRAIGKPLPSDPVAGTGGTGAYGRYYANVAMPFDVNAQYPAGTLIGRYFRDSVDQGHVAVVLGNGRVLQSFAFTYGGTLPGVNATYTVAESHGDGYYEYAVLPQDWLGN
jgi:cell wall-associated NlpC family hydrolase